MWKLSSKTRKFKKKFKGSLIDAGNRWGESSPPAPSGAPPLPSKTTHEEKKMESQSATVSVSRDAVNAAFQAASQLVNSSKKASKKTLKVAKSIIKSIRVEQKRESMHSGELETDQSSYQAYESPTFPSSAVKRVDGMELPPISLDGGSPSSRNDVATRISLEEFMGSDESKLAESSEANPSVTSAAFDASDEDLHLAIQRAREAAEKKNNETKKKKKKKMKEKKKKKKSASSKTDHQCGTSGKPSWWSRFRRKGRLSDPLQSLHSNNPLSHRDLDAAARSVSVSAIAEKAPITPPPKQQQRPRMRTNSAADLAAPPRRLSAQGKPSLPPKPVCPKSPADHGGGLTVFNRSNMIMGFGSGANEKVRRGSDACDGYRRFA